MEFRILGHAALEVERGGVRLVVDPWLEGSCYWGSWWHFPESVPLTAPLTTSDFVYITHGHPDHLHGPSLERIDRKVTVLLPRLPLPYLRDAIESLGFVRVIELDHGKPYALARDFRVTSYQAGWVNDSALLIESPEARVGNFNDALFPPALLASLAARHAPLDFMLKSHSSASAYPHCFESEDPEDLALYGEEDFIGNFFHYAQVFDARYAVPFASNVCFLHEETRAHNKHVIGPERLEAMGRSRGTRVMRLLPGDAWSSRDGFSISSGDVLSRRDAEIERLATRAAPALSAQSARERARDLRFEEFERYFAGFLASLPPALPWIHRARIAFAAPDDGWWVLDLARREVELTRRSEHDADVRITMAPGLLGLAIDEGLFGFVDISKRMRVELKPGCILRYAMFKELVNLYEAGYFPLWRNLLRRRFVGVWLRRWRELLSYARGVILRGPGALVPKPPAKPADAR